MGTAIHFIVYGINTGAAEAGHGIGMTLVWFVDHPLAAVPGAILLVVTIARSLNEED